MWNMKRAHESDARSQKARKETADATYCGLSAEIRDAGRRDAVKR